MQAFYIYDWWNLRKRKYKKMVKFITTVASES